MEIKDRFPIGDLPSELLLYMLFHLSDPQYVAYLSRVGTKVNANLKDADKKGIMLCYWYELYRRDFPKKNKEINFDKNTDYKELYRKASQERKESNRGLFTKQSKLYGWIRSGDLESIERQKWHPETDFGGTFDAEGNTAISLACSYKRKTILNYFYQRIHASISSSNRKDRKTRLLFWAAACNKIDADIILDNSKFINQSFAWLDTLAGTDEVLNQSENLKHIFDGLFRRPVQEKALTKLTPLCIAAHNGNLEAMQALIVAGAKVNHPADNADTALAFAVKNEQLEAVEFLISEGADVNQPCRYNVTPLSYAAARENLKIIQCLLEAGANVDHSDNNGGTPLYYAVYAGHLSVVQALLDAGAKTNQDYVQVFVAETVLYRAAASGQLEIVQALLAAGAEVNRGCYSGTPLCAAARRGHFKVVQVLLQTGAKTDQLDFDNHNSSSIAAIKGHLEIYELLKMWDAQLKEELLFKKVIVVLETRIQLYTLADQLDSIKSLFFSNRKKCNDPLEIVISTLKEHCKSENSATKEILIKLLQENRSNIPASKYKFIFEYLLADKILVATQTLNNIQNQNHPKSTK